MKDEFARLDATAQALLVRRGEVTPLELVDAAIARVERLNPALNAVTAAQFEGAREVARNPLPEGPFRGVPFLLKDLGGGAEAGKPLTQGSALLRNFVPDYDSELVLRFKRAGLVIIGRTSTPEFGIPPTTEPALFGPCRNPWNLEHSTGGSSGGAAAAVAARLVPFAHASDAGGSIRIPASVCGLFGLKPTRGRSPMAPKLGESTAGLTAELCVSVSVRDSAALLDAIQGPAVGDPYTAPPLGRSYVAELAARPTKLRVGVMREPLNGAAVHPDCLAAVELAIAQVRELGHEVVEQKPSITDHAGFFASFITVWTVAAAVSLRAAEELAGRDATEADVEPLTWALSQMGRQCSGPDYVLATRRLHRASRDIARFFVDHDALITPVLAQPPVRIGELACPPEEPLRGFIKSGGYAAFTPVFNITGQPAMSVPLHVSPEGLPIGVQFAGRFGDEAALFRLAAELERAHPWASRLPPLSA
ncbi:MAG TPA: amidase family protein [Polyangiaceae bacterium]